MMGMQRGARMLRQDGKDSGRDKERTAHHSAAESIAARKDVNTSSIDGSSVDAVAAGKQRQEPTVAVISRFERNFIGVRLALHFFSYAGSRTAH